MKENSSGNSLSATLLANNYLSLFNALGWSVMYLFTAHPQEPTYLKCVPHSLLTEEIEKSKSRKSRPATTTIRTLNSQDNFF